MPGYIPKWFTSCWGSPIQVLTVDLMRPTTLPTNPNGQQLSVTAALKLYIVFLSPATTRDYDAMQVRIIYVRWLAYGHRDCTPMTSWISNRDARRDTILVFRACFFELRASIPVVILRTQMSQYLGCSLLAAYMSRLSGSPTAVQLYFVSSSSGVRITGFGAFWLQNNTSVETNLLFWRYVKDDDKDTLVVI